MKDVLVIWVWRQWKEHVKALINLRGKKIKNIYIYDVDVDWIKSFAISNNLQQLLDISEIDNFKIDFCILCIPNNLHLWVMKILIDKGIHILKEKPFIMNLSELDNIKKYNNKNLVIKCCQQRIYNWIYDFIKNNLSKLWKIEYINYTFTLNDLNNSWYWDHNEWGGCFYWLSWHCLYFFSYFFGNLIEISWKKITWNKRDWNYKTDDTNNIYLKYRNWMTAYIYTSVVSPVKREVIEIHWSKWLMYIDRDIFYINLWWKISSFKNNRNSWYEDQIIDFIKIIDMDSWFVDTFSFKTLWYMDKLN